MIRIDAHGPGLFVSQSFADADEAKASLAQRAKACGIDPSTLCYKLWRTEPDPEVAAAVLAAKADLEAKSMEADAVSAALMAARAHSSTPAEILAEHAARVDAAQAELDAAAAAVDGVRESFLVHMALRETQGDFDASVARACSPPPELNEEDLGRAEEREAKAVAAEPVDDRVSLSRTTVDAIQALAAALAKADVSDTVKKAAADVADALSSKE